MRQIQSLVVIFLIFISTEIEANGTTYLDDCLKADNFIVSGKFTNVSDRYDVGYCVGVIQGVLDTLTIITSRDYQGTISACLPKELTMKQSVKVVIKYLQDNPQYLHEREVGLVLSALTRGFPCKANAAS